MSFTIGRGDSRRGGAAGEWRRPRHAGAAQVPPSLKVYQTGVRAHLLEDAQRKGEVGFEAIARKESSKAPATIASVLENIYVLSQDATSGCPACEAMLEKHKTAPSLVALVAAVQELSDTDARWFFHAGGYGAFLHHLDADYLPVAETWREILTRVFSDEEEAERLWAGLCACLTNQLLCRSVVITVVQDNITHLALTSGLRPEAIGELARDMPLLEGACGETLLAMAQAYHGAPSCEQMILKSLCVMHLLRLSAPPAVGRTRPTVSVSVTCLALVAAHHALHPSLWCTEDDAAGLAVFAAALIPMLIYGEVTGAPYAELTSDIWGRDDSFPILFALALLRHLRAAPNVPFLEASTMKVLLELPTLGFAMTLENILVAGVIAGRTQQPPLIETRDLVACTSLLQERNAFYNTSRALFDANLFTNLLAIHYGLTRLDCDDPYAVSIATLRERVASGEPARYSELPRYFNMGPRGMLLVLDSGDNCMLELLCKMGSNPYRETDRELCAFEKAVGLKSWNAVSTFLRHYSKHDGAEPTVARRQCMLTPLMLLLDEKQTPMEVLELAITCGANINARVNGPAKRGDYAGPHSFWTTMHFAAAHSLGAVQLLVQHSPDLVARSQDGAAVSPLMRACSAARVDVARFLLANGASIKAFLRTPVPTIATLAQIPSEQHSQRRELLELLLSHGAEINTVYHDEQMNPRSLLRDAVFKGDVAFVHELLDRGAVVKGRDLNSSAGMPRDFGRPATDAAKGDMALLLLAHGWTFDTPVLFRTRTTTVATHTSHSGQLNAQKHKLLDTLRVFTGEYSAGVAEVLNRLYPSITESVESFMVRMFVEVRAVVERATKYNGGESWSSIDLARILHRGLCIADQYGDWNGRTKIHLSDPRVFASVPRRLVPHHYTPLAFRRASRALALLRTSAQVGMNSGICNGVGHSVWAELPLELFEVVLDELFLLERAARGELSTAENEN